MPVHRVGDGGGPQEWYNSLPPVSKVLFTSVIGVFVLTFVGALHPAQIHLDYPQIKKNFQIWRLFTNAVYFGGPGFAFFMNLMMVVRYSPLYEQDAFDTGGGGGSADYAFMLLFGLTLVDLIGIFVLTMPFMGLPMLYMLIYACSRKTPNADASFYGISFKAIYLPWVLLGISMIMGNDVVPGIVGIAVGHLYYFLVEVVPDVYGKELLRTPSFLLDFFGGNAQPYGPGVTAYPAPGVVPAPRGPGRVGGHSWGSGGRVLGSD